MTTPHEVNFITGNANKLSEVRAILEPTGIAVRNQALDLPEIQGSLEDVTREKCRVAADLVKGPVLVEDTCLCFNALNGLPGPYMYVFFFFLSLLFLPYYCLLPSPPPPPSLPRPLFRNSRYRNRHVARSCLRGI